MTFIYLIHAHPNLTVVALAARPVPAEPVNARLLDALKLAECVYRKNVVNEGEPSSVLEAMQAAITAADDPEADYRRQPEEVLVAWRYRFRNAKGWGSWLLHDGPDKPVNVAFDAIELWPLYARSACIEEKSDPQSNNE